MSVCVCLIHSFRSQMSRHRRRSPYGYRYEVVQEGYGRVPTRNDAVKIDEIWCRDAFDGQDKFIDRRGYVSPVGARDGWARAAVLSMREGEVRQIILPPGYSAPFYQMRLISIE